MTLEEYRQLRSTKPVAVPEPTEVGGLREGDLVWLRGAGCLWIVKRFVGRKVRIQSRLGTYWQEVKAEQLTPALFPGAKVKIRDWKTAEVKGIVQSRAGGGPHWWVKVDSDLMPGDFGGTVLQSVERLWPERQRGA